MALAKRIVLHYLAQHVANNGRVELPTVLEEVSEGLASVPSSVIEAYNALTEYEFWEIVREVAVAGKLRSKNMGIGLGGDLRDIKGSIPQEDLTGSP